MGKSGSKRSGLTKADLAARVYDRHGGLTRPEAAQVVDTILATLKQTLLDGRAVRITNFGTFELTRRVGRRGVNPSNGEPMFIPPRTSLSFRPARRLRDELTPGGDGSEEGPKRSRAKTLRPL